MNARVRGNFWWIAGQKAVWMQTTLKSHHNHVLEWCQITVSPHTSFLLIPLTTFSPLTFCHFFSTHFPPIYSSSPYAPPISLTTHHLPSHLFILFLDWMLTSTSPIMSNGSTIIPVKPFHRYRWQLTRSIQMEIDGVGTNGIDFAWILKDQA